MNALAHHHYPWTRDETRLLVAAKARRVCHKDIARELCRTPRSVDQRVARLKSRGLLAKLEEEMNGDTVAEHRAEELALLAVLRREARLA